MVAGNVADVRWNFQSAKGSAASASAYGAFLAGGNIVDAMRAVEPFEETTGAQMRQAHYVATAQAAGGPEFFVPPKAMASLLYAVLGDVTTTGSEDPWTHTIKHADTRPWLTVWSRLGTLYRESRDVKVDQLVISGSSSQPLRVTPTFSGLDPRSSSAHETTATIEATNRVLYYDGKGALKIEGAADATIGSFTLTINRSAEIIYGDDVIPIANEEGLFSVSVALERLWASPALANRLHFGGATPPDHTAAVKEILTLGGDPAGLDLKWTRATGRSLQLLLPTLQVAGVEATPNTTGAALRESITLEAFDSGAAEPITAVVLNDMDDLTP